MSVTTESATRSATLSQVYVTGLACGASDVTGLACVMASLLQMSCHVMLKLSGGSRGGARGAPAPAEI